MSKEEKKPDVAANVFAGIVVFVLIVLGLHWCKQLPKASEPDCAKVGQKVHTNGPRWLFFDENDLDSVSSIALKDQKAAERVSRKKAADGKAKLLKKGTPLTVEKVHYMNEAYYVFTEDGHTGWVQWWWVE